MNNENEKIKMFVFKVLVFLYLFYADYYIFSHSSFYLIKIFFKLKFYFFSINPSLYTFKMNKKILDFYLNSLKVNNKRMEKKFPS